MQNAIGRLNWLNQLWNGGIPRPEATYPPLNLWDDGESFHAEAELPGFKIEDIELSVAGCEFQICGKRAIQAKEGWTLHRQERADGEFSRTITFPAEIDADKVQAALRDGVLSVTLPKAPSAKPRKIEVKLLGHKK